MRERVCMSIRVEFQLICLDYDQCVYFYRTWCMCIVGYQLLLNDTSQNLFVIAIRMTTVNCSWKFNRIAFWKLNYESYDFL